MPVSLAWEAFGPNKGAPSFAQMLDRIAPYRDAANPRRADYDIGCIVLSNPFFFEPGEWIPAPDDFAKNLVASKAIPYSELTLLPPCLGRRSFRVLLTVTYERRCAITAAKALQPSRQRTSIRSV